MAKIKMTAEEWLSKASWEGGVVPAMRDYGLSENDLDPIDDPELFEAVKRVSEGLKALDTDIRYISEQVDQYAC